MGADPREKELFVVLLAEGLGSRLVFERLLRAQVSPCRFLRFCRFPKEAPLVDDPVLRTIEERRREPHYSKMPFRMDDVVARTNVGNVANCLR